MSSPQTLIFCFVAAILLQIPSASTSPLGINHVIPSTGGAKQDHTHLMSYTNDLISGVLVQFQVDPVPVIAAVQGGGPIDVLAVGDVPSTIDDVSKPVSGAGDTVGPVGDILAAINA